MILFNWKFLNVHYFYISPFTWSLIYSFILMWLEQFLCSLGDARIADCMHKEEKYSIVEAWCTAIDRVTPSTSPTHALQPASWWSGPLSAGQSWAMARPTNHIVPALAGASGCHRVFTQTVVPLFSRLVYLHIVLLLLLIIYSQMLSLWQWTCIFINTSILLARPIARIGYEQNRANQPTWRSGLLVNIFTFNHQKWSPTNGRPRYVHFLCSYSYKHMYRYMSVY